jgi:hypothetical protein
MKLMRNTDRPSKSALRRQYSLIGLLACLSAPLFAQTLEEEQEVAEAKIQLPAPPVADKLVGFYSNAAQSFVLDMASLSITADGIVRYTVVSTSAAGAKNISYEGIRCSSVEKKLYAIGRPDGTWSNARVSKWDRIYNNNFNRHHAVLAFDYFCEGKTIAGDAETIINRIKKQQPIKAY